MIGVDTNILVRYLTKDDAEQLQVVDALIEEAIASSTLIYIDDVVLCELVWVLRSGYQLEKTEIASILERMLLTAVFAFEDRALLSRAIDSYREGRGGLADYVIGARNRRAGCEHTVTFDRAFSSSEDFQLLRSRSS